jgi:hypothetical protein
MPRMPRPQLRSKTRLSNWVSSTARSLPPCHIPALLTGAQAEPDTSGRPLKGSNPGWDAMIPARAEAAKNIRSAAEFKFKGENTELISAFPLFCFLSGRCASPGGMQKKLAKTGVN